MGTVLWQVEQWRERLSSKQRHELIHAQARLPNDGAERAAVEFRMIGHDDLSKGIIPAHDHVAAMLPHQDESRPCQRPDAVAAGDPR